MNNMILQIVMAMLGAVGFGMLFHMRGGKLIAAGIGGAANWIFYLLAFHLYHGRVMAFFLAALATALLAEVLARVLKTPVLTLLVPMLVPLVPGGDLYYTTLALVQGDMTKFTSFGNLALKEAGAISFGIILVTCLVQTVLKVLALRRRT